MFWGGIAEKNRGFNGSLTEFKRELNRKYDGILTGIERNPNVNIVNAVGETFISGAEITKLLLRKDLLFEDKRLDLTPC